MDKYRPKRPTTLALFPRQPPGGTQDSINNNSLGKKESWKKDSRSSSPHVSGDVAPAASRPKAEDKVQHGTRRPAPKTALATGAAAHTRLNGPTAATTSDTRTRDKQLCRTTNSQPSTTPRSQRRTTGAGRGTATMKERSQRDSRSRDAVKDDRKGGRLCEESRGKDRDRTGPPRTRESTGAKGKLSAKVGKKEGGVKPNNAVSTQEVYLTAMVVPRTPVAPRNPDKTQKQGQNHNRSQEKSSTLSRSSSDGVSNRMSISSDSECTAPLCPSLPQQINPDIREEEAEAPPTPAAPVRSEEESEIERRSDGRVDEGEEQGEVDALLIDSSQGGSEAAGDTGATGATGATGTPEATGAAGATGTPEATGAAGATGTPGTTGASGAALLNYDSVKYTLVVDEHAQLELVSLKDCWHGYNEHNDDSDAETVYQSANEEEDPDYQEDGKRGGGANHKGRSEEDKKKTREEEEMKRRKEEDLRRRREEEIKRRREVVARVWKQPKVTSSAAAEVSEGHRGRASQSRKFVNLFGSSATPYSATGAGSFGLFSCVLDGVERQQSHRAVYRFVPRHEDELSLEADDPVLMLVQSEDLWCQGYNMRTGIIGIFPAFYVVKVAKETNQVPQDGWNEQFLVRFLGSVLVPIHKGNDVLCAAMQKVACSRRRAGQPPSACVLEVSDKGVKISVQDQCHSARRGEQCFHFFQLKNISFCGCHPKHSKYFGFITKHPDEQRFACHVMMSDTTLLSLAETVGRAFQQFYKEHMGYSCPTEDIFIE